MKLLISISLLLSMITADKVKVWKESKGVVVVEAEHNEKRNALPAYWEIVKSLQGYETTGFVQWKGTSYINDNYDKITEHRILTYYVSVQKEGSYYFKIKGICFDEAEAKVLIRVNGSKWKSFTIPNDGKVNWDTNPLEESNPSFLQYGYHKIEIAGVSSGFLFDKFIMAHSSLIDVPSEDNFAMAFEKWKESKSEYIVDENFPNR